MFNRERCVTPTRLLGAKGDPRTRPRESPFLEHSFQDFTIAQLRDIKYDMIVVSHDDFSSFGFDWYFFSSRMRTQ